MIWTAEGTHFLTGTDCLITLFDVSRNGSGPLNRLPTIPSKRHNMKGGGVGMRGIVSSISLQPQQSLSSTSLLAAGTWTRWIGLYDAGGLGGTVANWSVATAADSTAKISGAGVSQTLWSPCGRYLTVVERKSRGVLIYDIRVTGRLVGWLEGRTAETNQRLGVDVFGAPGGDGKSVNETEIWAGGLDGVVKVWKWRGVGNEGDEDMGLAPEREWPAHESAVSGVAVHPSGTVVATSSGQRQEIGDFEEEGDIDSDDASGISETSSRSIKRKGKPPDNRIKIWSI
jgi:telomerase Cajal body protein 1